MGQGANSAYPREDYCISTIKFSDFSKNHIKWLITFEIVTQITNIYIVGKPV